MPHPSSNPSPAKATLPPDTRIYAIGDVHGRADLLQEVISRIDEDLQRRPIAFAGEVYVGDYIDRGADSKGVLDLLAVRLVQNHAICLRGNHEALMEEFLFKAYRGKGFGKMIQGKILVRLSTTGHVGEYLFGSIAVDNMVSLKTAAANGRLPFMYSYFASRKSQL